VPRFRDEPREAEWWSWKAWEWVRDRSAREKGEGVETRWPAAAAVKLGVGLGKGEKEREKRSTRYEVWLSLDDGRRHLHQPATAEELARFPVGSTHRLRVERSGLITPLPP
jgi:hypothetical protein